MSVPRRKENDTAPKRVACQSPADRDVYKRQIRHFVNSPNLSRSGGKAPEAPAPPDAGKDKPAKEVAPPDQGVAEPTAPPRPVEEGKLVYLKLSELHPFHTFRPHPFKVRDDAKMQETVSSIKLNGVMVPGLARPEKDGNGYEIVAGHRRCRGSELAGLEEMPFIVREMTDHEAVPVSYTHLDVYKRQPSWKAF